MTMLNRLVNIPQSNSFFLFGARGVGKSTLLRESFVEANPLWIDLLNVDLERRLLESPSLLRTMYAEHIRSRQCRSPHWIVIDEVQKIPALLNIVHSMIETEKALFAITGSSARKLRREQANLLAGRAFVRKMFPLTHKELGDQFDLTTTLSWGTLPRVLALSDGRDRSDFLRAYADTYLREEIIMEQLVRKIPAFRKFLEVAGQSAGKILNFAKIGRDINADAATVHSYFEILEDTLIANLLPPYHTSIRKRQRQTPKLYFFDSGVQRALARTLDLAVRPGTYQFGDAFEQFIITEIIRLAEYSGKDWSFSYLRTKDDAEIDLIIDRPGMPLAAIEIKSSDKIESTEVNAFQALTKDLPNSESFFLSRDPVAQKIHQIHCLDWQSGIKALGL